MQEFTEKQEEALKEAEEVMDELKGEMEKISHGIKGLLDQGEEPGLDEDAEHRLDDILQDIESTQTELFSLGARLDDSFA